MSMLNGVVRACEAYNTHVETEVRQARTDKKLGQKYTNRWTELQSHIAQAPTATGMMLPRLALPEIDEPGAIARYLLGHGIPGQFPFVTSAYPEMYLESLRATSGDGADSKPAEEPTRLFAGLGLAEDTNARFHYLTQHQKSIRLSTAFDGPTACLERSGRAVSQLIPSTTWSGCMRDLILRIATRLFP